LLISHDVELLKLVKNIIRSNLNDTELRSWWKSYCIKYNKTEIERAFDYFVFPSTNKAGHIVFKSSEPLLKITFC
jgi:hypothetical protein